MAVASYILPRFKAVDDFGRPMVGARLYTYINKTTTPASTYRDADQSAANTNPVILNASGEAILYLLKDQVYTFVLRNWFDVPIWSQDNVTGAASPQDVQQVVDNLAAAGGAALVGYTPIGAGVPPATVQRKLEDSVSLMVDFGAAADGSTDDTGVFASLEAVVSGQIIDLNGKTYKVTSFPSGNVYVNGFWKTIDPYDSTEKTYIAFQDAAILASFDGDTGGYGSPYTGGTGVGPSISGRSTPSLKALIASQGCISTFSRSLNGASIYSQASGNCSANIAARQSGAQAPQTFNAASEECVATGFNGANIAASFSLSQGTRGINAGTRLTHCSANYNANIASNTSDAGGGWGFSGTLVFDANGSITSVTIKSGGIRYSASATLQVRARQLSPTVNAVLTPVLDANGTVISVTITNAGSGYTGIVDVDMLEIGDQSANMATTNCQARAAHSANIACTSSIASGTISANLGSTGNSVASADRAVNIGGSQAVASGSGAITLGAVISEAAHVGAVVMGRRVISASDRSFVLGDGASGAATTANRKIELRSSGNASMSGTLTQNAVFTDIAKLFENSVAGTEIPVGALVTLEGRKVRLAVAGDRWLSAHSRSYVQLLGGDSFSWAHQYLTGEFGEKLYQDVACVRWEHKITWEGGAEDETFFGDDPSEPKEKATMVERPAYSGTEADAIEKYGSIPDDAVRYVEQLQIPNPDYDPSLANSHIQRTERPDEWTPVAMVGEVHVRVDSTVLVDEYVTAGEVPGLGTHSEQETHLRCMAIMQPYSAAKGYAVALCERG